MPKWASSLTSEEVATNFKATEDKGICHFMGYSWPGSYVHPVQYQCTASGEKIEGTCLLHFEPDAIYE